MPSTGVSTVPATNRGATSIVEPLDSYLDKGEPNRGGQSVKFDASSMITAIGETSATSRSGCSLGPPAGTSLLSGTHQYLFSSSQPRGSREASHKDVHAPNDNMGGQEDEGEKNIELQDTSNPSAAAAACPRRKPTRETEARPAKPYSQRRRVLALGAETAYSGGSVPKCRTCEVVFSDSKSRSGDYTVHGVVPSRAIHRAANFASSVGCSTWPSDHQSAPISRVIHPHGFRLLKNTSVIERSMRTYFRLPPAPSRHLTEQRRRLHKTLLRIEQDEEVAARCVTGGGKRGLLLDGFLLLNAAAQDDPDQVEAVTLQATHLSGSVREDLEYFPRLSFLDVSENKLLLEDVLMLTGLETLHMAYNKISSLEGLQEAAQMQKGTGHPLGRKPQNSLRTELFDRAGGVFHRDDDLPSYGDDLSHTNMTTFPVTSKSLSGSDVLLPRLMALNLSYNYIPSSQVLLLAYFPCLERLDLSGNGLRSLPADLFCLTSVSHFALENNNFTSAPAVDSPEGTTPAVGGDVFHSLSTMPALVEVNLNHNYLSSVPTFSVQDGSGLCFPLIEIIGLSHNRFKSVESVLPLAHLHRTLRRVVLSDNPICGDRRAVYDASVNFDSVIIRTFNRRAYRETQQFGKTTVGGTTPPFDNIPSNFMDVWTPAEGNCCTPQTGTDWHDRTWTHLIPHMGQVNEGQQAGEHAQSDAAIVAASSTSAALVSTGATAARTAKTTILPPQATTASCMENATFSTDGVDMHPTPELPLHKNRGTPQNVNDAFQTAGQSSIRQFFSTAEEYLSHHHIDIIFNEVAMPKRSLQDFYAKQTRVDGRSTLVTIPSYSEFMDIHRITGNSKTRNKHRRRWRRNNFGGKVDRAYHQPTTPSAEHAANISPPMDDIPISPITSAPSSADEQQDPEDLDRATVQDDSAGVFFITELDHEDSCTRGGTHRHQQGRSMAEKSSADHEVLPKPKELHRAPILPAKQRTVVSQTHVKSSDFVAAPEPVLRSVVSPAITNVHAAMSELRSLLRKPLPPLPYASEKRTHV